MQAERVYVFDTTLRDGEQAAGTRLGRREKLIIARQLSQLRVDIIEAGYPNSSPEDFQAVEDIAREIRDVTICALSRAVPDDIHSCGKALAKAKRPRIHTGIGASDIHILGKFRDDKYGRTLAEKKVTILRMAIDAVKLAKNYADDVEFYAEDSGRSDPAYLFEMLEAVIDAGATVHCHDDLGLAVANALAGIQNGARQVEATINGIGERAGNASLEEIVMAIRTRADYFKVRTDIDTREFTRTSRLVSELLGIPVPPNKAIVGANAFSHSSGIHVDGFLKDRQTYEIMRPEDVGLHESRVVLTARTGRAGLRDRLEKLGFALLPEELDQAYTRFLSIADKKQEVFDEDLMAMLHEELQPASEDWQLEHLHISGGTSSVPTASVRLKVNGESREATSTGDGPIDAVYKALAAITHSSVKLQKYEIRSVTSGTEALGEATVHLEQGDSRVVGRGASTDIIEASAKAYVDGLNKLARLSANSA